MLNSAPPVRDLVLVGGGHSHVQVLKSFGMRPLAGVRVTIISREVRTPYSGMLPGHVAGLYDADALHIDLGRLSVFANARLIVDEVAGLDTNAKRLSLIGHPDLHYDFLSINTGAVPTLPWQTAKPLACSSNIIPVKPISQFLPRWRALTRAVRVGETVVIVGGGAGGVELALAARRTLPKTVNLTLLTDSLLSGHSSGVRERLLRALTAAGIEVHVGVEVSSFSSTQLRCVDGKTFTADWVLLVTGVGAPDWPREAGLATDERGFIQVDGCLRSVSHPDVFAAGDVAELQGQPRPKAGVFAVREGPVLDDNLRRAVLDKPGRRFRAQRRFLTIMGTGDGRAVAGRGAIAVEGRWVWYWKDWIDRRFMARFNHLPTMPETQWKLPAVLAEEAPDVMRCGGCGAKLGANPLLRVLERLPHQHYPQVALGIGDDAALIHTDCTALIQTVDGFRSFIDDPYLFGRITAHHSLNDIFAMGGRGLSALALATVPLMAETMMEEDLYQMLFGAVSVLADHDVPLVGGHSAEGAELTLGLALTGMVDGRLLAKSDLQPDHALVLTKPLGTGVLLAANMRGELPADKLQGAIANMDTSNRCGLDVLRTHRVAAATDVSGFGLLGHLGEMLRASNCGARIALDSVPVLSGAVEQMASGVMSSLQVSNEQACTDFELSGTSWADPRARLLADPQTSGGLLAAVPTDSAEDCVTSLVSSGYEQAAIIGIVTPSAAVIQA